MASICKATIVGNLGADPEKRFTQDGRAVTKFRVAVNSRRRDQGGEWSDHTEWFGVTAFGRQAETAAERLTKGSRVYVDGRLESRTWDGPDGKRFFMDIVANEVLPLDSRPRDEMGGGDFGGDDFMPAERPAAAPRMPRQAPVSAPDAGDLDDLPF
jgi:single-strand DNA-binding protein